MSVGIESGFSSDEVLSCRFPLHRACRDGDVGALSSLLQLTPTRDLLQEDSFYGWTPIHWAAHFGKLECVMRLVQVGCEVNAMTTRFAQTPVHIAAFGGHPDCVLWLLQAGADINRQDYVGETPIHKAARAGSMECINALLMQAAKPDLTNASGLTPADLAHAQGFRECAQLLSNAQNHVSQLNGFHANMVLNGNSLSGSLLRGVANRKRMLDGVESNHMKKARTDGLALLLRTQGCGGEDGETMDLESAQEPLSDDPKAAALRSSHAPSTPGPHRTPLHVHGSSSSLPSGSSSNAENGLFPGGADPEEAQRRQAADMCGSLHQTGSPSSCVSQRPSWGDPALQYGHYHGFGDTAEDLALSSRLDHVTSIQAQQRYQQAALGLTHLYHGS